jgi:hypothetical protein
MLNQACRDIQVQAKQMKIEMTQSLGMQLQLLEIHKQTKINPELEELNPHPPLAFSKY